MIQSATGDNQLAEWQWVGKEVNFLKAWILCELKWVKVWKFIGLYKENVSNISVHLHLWTNLSD